MPSESPKERLVSTAMRLFHENGYAATGIAAILKAADVRSGTLYYFFPTKEDLLVAVLEKYVTLLMPAVMQPSFATTDDPIERVFAVLAGYREHMIQTSFTRGCPIGNLALELSDAKPAVRALIAANFDLWCGAIQACLDAASDRLPPDLDRRALSRFVLTIMEGAIMQVRAHKSIEPFDTAIAQLRDYISRLTTQPDRRTS